MAQGFYDFSGIGIGAGLPAGWTSFGTLDGPSRVAGPAILVGTSFGVGAVALASPEVGTGDWDVVVRVQSNTAEDVPRLFFGIEGAAGTVTGFITEPAFGGANWRLMRRIDDAEDFTNWVESALGFAYTANLVVWQRMRRRGDTLTARIWTGNASDEPATWNNTITLTGAAVSQTGRFATIASGYTERRIDLIGWATDADVAPTSGAVTATQLGFGTQPQNTVVGQTMPAFTVRILDAGGNLVSTATDAVTIARQAGAGTLAGTLTRNAVAGVATFNDVSLATLNTGATIRATASGLTQVDSAGFNITAGGGGGSAGRSLLSNSLVG